MKMDLGCLNEKKSLVVVFIGGGSQPFLFALYLLLTQILVRTSKGLWGGDISTKEPWLKIFLLITLK